MFRGVSVLGAFVIVGCLSVDISEARGPRWSPNVIARGAQRQQIQSTPITQRPNRPLHFYGNTVRRRHYRGIPAPAPGAYSRSTQSAGR